MLDQADACTIEKTRTIRVCSKGVVELRSLSVCRHVAMCSNVRFGASSSALKGTVSWTLSSAGGGLHGMGGGDKLLLEAAHIPPQPRPSAREQLRCI